LALHKKPPIKKKKSAEVWKEEWGKTQKGLSLGKLSGRGRAKGLGGNRNRWTRVNPVVDYSEWKRDTGGEGKSERPVSEVRTKGKKAGKTL